jgi:hypothetical protein
MNIFEPKVPWPVAVPLKQPTSERLTFSDVLCEVRKNNDREYGEDWNGFLARTDDLALMVWERVSPTIDPLDTDDLRIGTVS